MNIITDSLFNLISSSLLVISAFIPKLLAGLLILLIGVVIASLIRDVIKIVFKYVKLEQWMEAAGLAKSSEMKIWPNLLAELARWTIIFIFLMSAIESWGVPKVGDVLNQLLLFLPNVFIAVIIGWIGLVTGRFASDIVRHGINGVGGKEAIILGNVAKYSIIFFTTLIILSQLGVAAELVKILFTGIIGMLALAFGLSFGLGGQHEAKNILEKLRKRIEMQSQNPIRRKRSRTV